MKKIELVTPYIAPVVGLIAIIGVIILQAMLPVDPLKIMFILTGCSVLAGLITAIYVGVTSYEDVFFPIAVTSFCLGIVTTGTCIAYAIIGHSMQHVLVGLMTLVFFWGISILSLNK